MVQGALLELFSANIRSLQIEYYLGTREPIAHKKLLIRINDKQRNKLVESDCNTVWFSPGQWQTYYDLPVEDMNFLELKLSVAFCTVQRKYQKQTKP